MESARNVRQRGLEQSGNRKSADSLSYSCRGVSVRFGCLQSHFLFLFSSVCTSSQANADMRVLKEGIFQPNRRLDKPPEHAYCRHVLEWACHVASAPAFTPFSIAPEEAQKYIDRGSLCREHEVAVDTSLPRVGAAASAEQGETNRRMIKAGLLCLPDQSS